SWAVAGPDEDLNFGSLMAHQKTVQGASLAEAHQPPSGPSAVVPLFQDDWHSMNARLVAMRSQQFKYPWEVTSRSVRPRLNAWRANLFPNPLLGRFDRPTPTTVVAVSSEPWAWTARNTFEARRLLAARFAKTDDQMLLAAFKKIRSIEDAFAGKAPGTLLKRAGASPTSADSFVKALRFFVYHTGAYMNDPAPPLPVSHVRALEEFVIDTRDHARTAHYKTRAKDRQNRMLPLLALGRTLVQPGWGAAWIKHREAAGISGHSCLMRPIEAYTSHSLKATALSWSAKSGTMSYEERLTQGHHVHPKLGVALLYSRDAMAEIMVKVGRIVRAIVSGAFSPDLPRAQRMALALQKAPEDFSHLPETQPDLVDGDDEVPDVESEGSDLSDTELLKGLQALNLPSAPDAVRPRIEATFAGNVFMHILTGVVHCEALPGKFKCGRPVTANMRLMSQGEAQNHVCQQCAAVDSGA
ncbi:unnamed protein product, partial [Symbiodinium sp. CCMP2456]